MTIEMSHVRNPNVAMWLSTFGIGAGQIYCGRVGRGLVMFCVSLMLWPAMAILVFTGSTSVVVVGLGILLTVMTAFNIWSARDAKGIARRMAAIEFEPQEYNRPIVYGLMILVWFPYVFGLAFFLRSSVIEAFVIPSQSMAPSFVPGDRILASKLGIDTAIFQRGDVVVFHYPQNRQQNYIKRIIGLPGETVEIKAGKVLINGQPLPSESIPGSVPIPANGDGNNRACFEGTGEKQYMVFVGSEDQKVDLPERVIPASSYFVLGDHRRQSLDSRVFGAIPHGDIIGRVIFNYRPGDTWKRFGPVH